MQHLLVLLLLASSIISGESATAVAPAPSPSNLTALLLSSRTCSPFARLLLSTPSASDTFQSSASGGLTVFCPSPSALSSFAPTFKNLSADDKLSLLLFHALPVFYSLSALKSGNGVVNTLATDGGGNNNYNLTVQNDGEVVTLQTGIDVARIVGKVFDENPVEVFEVDKVLQARELFKPAPEPAPAPAPEKPEKKPGHASPPAPPGPEATPGPAKEEHKVADEHSGAPRMGFAAAAAASVLVWI